MEKSPYARHFGLRLGLFQSRSARDLRTELGESRRAIAAGLSAALTASDALVLLTGQSGVGKTTLCHEAVRDRLKDAREIWLGTRPEGVQELLEMLLVELDLLDVGRGRAWQLGQWKEQVTTSDAAGKPLLILVEDAHDLSVDILRGLDELSRPGPNGFPGARVVLMGTPRLARLIDDPNLERLRQRVRLEVSLPPMSADDMRRFFIDCSKRAGSRRKKSIFGPGTLELLHSYAGGIPRVAQNLCESALTLGAARDEKQLSALTVRDSALLLHKTNERAGARSGALYIPLAGPAAPESRAGGKTAVEEALGIDNGFDVPRLTDIVGIDPEYCADGDFDPSTRPAFGASQTLVPGATIERLTGGAIHAALTNLQLQTSFTGGRLETPSAVWIVEARCRLSRPAEAASQAQPQSAPSEYDEEEYQRQIEEALLAASDS